VHDRAFWHLAAGDADGRLYLRKTQNGAGDIEGLRRG